MVPLALVGVHMLAVITTGTQVQLFDILSSTQYPLRFCAKNWAGVNQVRRSRAQGHNLSGASTVASRRTPIKTC